MRNQIRLFLALLFAIAGLVNRAAAQDTVLNIHYQGLLDSVHSAILNQQRMIQVFVPPGYKAGSAEKYDVLYVLDGGNWNTGLIAQLQRFVESQDFMPHTIIVSIMEPDRNADLTPTHIDVWTHSGGAGKFLGFIKNDLIPYINTHYPSNGDNTLWGHSLSGMFVLYTLVNEPTLFKSYIAIDPSVWWDNCLVVKMAAAKLPAMPLQNTTFFIAGRESDMKDMKIDTLDIVLKKAAPANLKWKLNVYPAETHGSVRLKGTYDALKFTYEGHIKNMYFSPMGGIVLKDKPFKLFYPYDTTHMYYTVDGTVPTINSPKVRAAITVNGPAKVTYKVFTNRDRYNKITTGLFIDEKMPKPLAKPGNWKSGGFNYAYYEGTWDKWPDLTKLKPTKTGITDSTFEVDKLPQKNHYALVIDGLIESKEEGYYIFGIQGDNGTKLYIDNKLMATSANDYGYDCIVPLSKGFYPFRVEYLHQHEGDQLEWQEYLPPGNIDSQNSILIPVNLQYSRR